MGGKYVQNSGDIASLFLVQNGISSFEGLGENDASKAFGDYMAFGVPANAPSGVSANGNDLSRLKPDMDKL